MIEFATLAAECAPKVHPVTLRSIVQHESGMNPYAINVNAEGITVLQPKSKSKAITQATELLQAGHNIDVGLGQINSANFTWLNATVERMFDPCENLKAAQAVLIDCYSRARKKYSGDAALHAALSCYNSGNFTYGITSGYVGKVLSHADLYVPAPAGHPAAGKVPVRLTATPPEPSFPNTIQTDVFGKDSGSRADQFRQKPEPADQDAAASIVSEQ